MKHVVLLGASLLALAASAAGQQALDVAGLSKTVDACTDFDAYVNRNWQDATPMPADRARIGSFDQLRIESKRQVELALAEAEKNPAVLDTVGKRLVATYHASGMDAAAIEKAGLEPLAPMLREIEAIKDRAQLAATMAHLARLRIGAPLAAWVFPDPKDKQRNVLQLLQAGLGLPDRDDYTRDDARTRAIKAAYAIASGCSRCRA